MSDFKWLYSLCLVAGLLGCDADRPDLMPGDVLGVDDVLGEVDNGQQLGGTDPNGQVIGGGGNGGGSGSACGNGAIDPPEQCEGSNLGGADCGKLGFASGTLLCDPTTCMLDDSMCVGVAGGGGGTGG